MPPLGDVPADVGRKAQRAVRAIPGVQEPQVGPLTRSSRVAARQRVRSGLRRRWAYLSNS